MFGFGAVAVCALILASSLLPTGVQQFVPREQESLLLGRSLLRGSIERLLSRFGDTGLNEIKSVRGIGHRNSRATHAVAHVDD